LFMVKSSVVTVTAPSIDSERVSREKQRVHRPNGAALSLGTWVTYAGIAITSSAISWPLVNLLPSEDFPRNALFVCQGVLLAFGLTSLYIGRRIVRL